MTVPASVLGFWRALDSMMASVHETPWGAVITDARFPAIWDANYARLDGGTPSPTLADVERDLLPRLREAGATIEHVVAFDPEAARAVLAELSTRGHRLGWDLVMARGTADAPPRGAAVDELPLDAPSWDDIRRSLTDSFGIEEGAPITQLMRLEREVLAPRGKRWFGVRDGDRYVSVAALLSLGGVAYVDNVATDEGFRGRGLASAVTARIVAQAAADGDGTVFLLADPEERATVGIYERLGFREVARLASTRGPIAG